MFSDKFRLQIHAEIERLKAEARGLEELLLKPEKLVLLEPEDKKDPEHTYPIPNEDLPFQM